VLPRPFGSAGETLASLAEAAGKMRAAVEARRDPSLVVLGRTGALRAEGLDACRRRVEAYVATGVDGIFLVGARTRAEIETLRTVTTLPFVLGSATAELQDRAWLAGQGVRVMLQGHLPFQAATRAMYETLKALRAGATAADLREATASAALLAELTAQAEYDRQIARYLEPGGV
jgi:carboxyvinyl-carboxyphosphonate phosphorylmutase